ncbi:MAG: M20/M25/M40 family metallo-hydrolase [Planctomycetota bacterium]
MILIRKSGSNYAIPSLIGLMGLSINSVVAQTPNPHALEETKPAAAAPAAKSPNTSAYLSAAELRMRQDVSYLAADAREGRGPGTSGIDDAAEYIANEFKRIGLKPAPNAHGYFQKFTITNEPSLEPGSKLIVKRQSGSNLVFDDKTDFSPLALGDSGKLAGKEIVFAGYGITAKDASLKLDYDDYAGLDVKGKVVLILRREPQLNDEKSAFAGKSNTAYAEFRHKATNAFQHGAAAVLLVNNLAGSEGKDPLMPFRAAGMGRNSTIPFVQISRVKGDEILKSANAPTLEQLEKEIDADGKPHSRLLKDISSDMEINIARKGVAVKNVVGVLEGSGPMADETIVIGGHYDHLGFGGEGSLAFGSKEIHNGADDNASGTTMVMEMARRLSSQHDPLPRRVVFILFSAEERGLLGSQHYVDNPLFPLDKTIAMVNFDMVGRLNDAKDLTVYGTGSSPTFEAIVDGLGKASGFNIKKINDGTGPSDHQSFYLKNLPVLFFFTGTHKEYHRPVDDVETINFQGMGRVANYTELVLLDLIRRPDRPVFTKVAGRAAGPGRVSLRAYLGSIPDYDDAGKGVKLSGVQTNSPAEKGGLKGGDIVIKMAGKPVGTIQDYMESLSTGKPGDEVEVVVKRDGKDVTLKVKLGNRPGN